MPCAERGRVDGWCACWPDDLVFKKADAIVGGREHVVDGGEERARSDTNNNFQARYAIRHPWTGPIACANPQRNVWGGPPSDKTPPSRNLAATNLAFAQRTGVALAELVKRDVPEIAVKATTSAPTVMPPAPSVGSGSAARTDEPRTSTASKGCGCDTGGAGGIGFADLAGLVALVWRRRRA